MITEKDRESIKPGVSILVEETKRKGKSKAKRNPSYDWDKYTSFEASFRLKSLRTLLLYLFLFVVMTSVLLRLDGVPHVPARIWSWAEIWDKLTGPATGVPLDFIKYLTCSLGWFMLVYVAFTLVLEGLVDIFYLFSVRLGGGQPGKVARGLKKATGLLPVSPLRRALDGLLLGAALFTVVTTVAGGHGTISGNSDIAIGSELERPNNTPEAAGLVLEAANNYQADYLNNNLASSEPDFYKVAFQPQDNSANFDNDYFQDLPMQGNTASPINGSVELATDFYGQETVEIKHKVEASDSLWSLAERYYGNGQLYPQIYQANLGQPMGGGHHFEASGRIQPGWVLTIPNVSKAQSNTTWDMTTYAPKPGQEQPQETYVVQSGDSMRAIAQKFLGDEMRWPEIWKLNVNQIMKDGRSPINPNLIYPGWELKLPNKAIEQPQQTPQPPSSQPITPLPEQPVGGKGNAEQPIKNPNPAPVPTQSPVIVTPPQPATTPANITAPTPAPATTSAPQIKPQPSVVQPIGAQLDQKSEQQVTWFWPVLEGLGGVLALTGLGLGLHRVGKVLRRKRIKGQLNQPSRSRWQAYREVNDWESENAPQTQDLPIVQINEWGDETGFASTKRPIELLKMRAKGFDIDRPKLVLEILQTVFAGEGLPPLRPISCIETGRRLTYSFTGSPQSLALYLKAASESNIADELAYSSLTNIPNEEDEEWEVTEEDDQEEMSSDKGKVIPFLSGFRHRKNESEIPILNEDETMQSELIETLISKLGGMAWIEKQRDGLVIILEGLEVRYSYTPVAVGKTTNTGEEAEIIEDEIELDVLAEFSHSQALPSEGETDENDVYRAYSQDDDESAEQVKVTTITKPINSLKVRRVEEVLQEFAQISQESGADQHRLHLAENFDEVSKASPLAYLLFGLGAIENKPFDFESATAVSDKEPDILEASHGHFQLCLDECSNFLLVSGKGDEAASNVLYSCVFQMAASAGPDDLALYLIDRSVALTDEEMQNIGLEFGLRGEAQANLIGELKHNREVFDLLTTLPQTVAVVTGEARSELRGQKTEWTQNTVNLIDTLLGELVRRQADAAGSQAETESTEEEEPSVNKPPRLVLVICDLAEVVAADESKALVQLLSEGPSWGIFILAATSYKAATIDSQSDIGCLSSLIPQFGSLGLFLAPDERSSEQLLGGSQAAFELSGEGDMLFRSVNRQQIRLRGFGTVVEQIREGVELLCTLYNFSNSYLDEFQTSEEPPLEKVEANLAEFIIEDEVEDLEVHVKEPEERFQTTDQTLEPEPNLPQSYGSTTTSQIEEGEERNFSVSIGRWRWQMLQKGLLQPAITIHVLHGLSVHFALLPTVQKNRSGKGHYFPFSPDPLAAFEQLQEVGLSYTLLAKAIKEGNDNPSLKLEESEVLKPQRIDELLGEILKLRETGLTIELADPHLIEHLLVQGYNLKEMEEAFVALQRILHNFAWLESDNLLPRMQNGDLALLSYLALHTGAQSRYTVGQAILKPTETDKQLLRNLEVRLTRTHKSLRGWIAAGLQEIFSDTSQAKEELLSLVETQKLYFIEEDTRRETLKLNDQLVWVDVGELDRLLMGYKQAVATPRSRPIEELEEAYWLVQSTTENYSDEVAESRLKLLGVWGDRYAADWEDLAIIRQYVIQSWFDLNMTLGDYYTKALNVSEQGEQFERLIAQAVEHYSQAALVQPTYPEPIKALIKLYHSKNDLSGLRVIYNDYCTNCQQDDQEPEEEVVEFYHNAIGSRRKKANSERSQAETRKVV